MLSSDWMIGNWEGVVKGFGSEGDFRAERAWEKTGRWVKDNLSVGNFPY